jgi:cobalt-zinc-cadmium efflux system membrane fusion protein
MKVLILAGAALVLASCGNDPVEAIQPAAAEAPVAAKAANSVVFSADLQARSGVSVITVSEQALPEVVHATAHLTADENHTWRVGAVAEGRIERVQANPGDVVKKGQLLAQMHSHDIHESRALYKRAKADLARAEGTAKYQEGVRDRAKRLLDLRAGSIAQLEQAETALTNAQTDVRNAGYEVDRTQAHLTEVLGIPADESEIPRGPDGDDNDYIPVKAPADGVVLSRNVTLGTVVTPSNDLFVLTDLSTLWAIAEVSEEFLGKLRIGMPVNVSVQAYPGQPFQGRISKVGEALDPSTRTIQVRIDLSNPKGRLKPEMYADAEIQVGRGAAALTLPSEAVQDLRGEAVVFVRVAADRFEVRPVRPGKTVNGAVEITAGLRAGDEVVARSAFILKSEFLKASMSGE